MLFEISSIDVFPKFWISYGLKDTEKEKNDILEKAIKDDKEKAKIIANTSKVQLDEILEINYSWIDIEMNTRPYALRKQTFLMYNSTVENRSFDVDLNQRFRKIRQCYCLSSNKVKIEKGQTMTKDEFKSMVAQMHKQGLSMINHEDSI